MIDLEPSRTRWDLQWRMFGIPVRVHPLFWLAALMLTFSGNVSLPVVLIGTVCLFVSILLHEFGHAFCQRYYGDRENHVVLWILGGLAVGSREPHRVWPRIAISLAGPGAGFVLGGAAFGAEQAIEANLLPMPNAYVYIALAFLALINITWGLINLLPVFPLDGGNIARVLLTRNAPYDGELRFFALSTVTGSVAALVFIVLAFTGSGWLGAAVLFGLLAYQSFSLRKQIAAQGGSPDGEEDSARQPWEQDPDWWKNGGR